MVAAAAALVTAGLTVVGVGSAHGAPARSQAGHSVAAAGQVSPGVAEGALTALQARIADYVRTHGTRYTFADYLDQGTGRIVLQTDAPAEVVASLSVLPGAPAEQQAAISQIHVQQATMSSLFDRLNDIEAYRGGAGITDASGVHCSSGYAVRNPQGSTLMITAGHCFTPGFRILTEQGGRDYGTLIDRRLPLLDATDFGVIGNKPYFGRIYVDGHASFHSLPVIGAGPAKIGNNVGNYCYSGRTSGERCGHIVTSNTAQVCTDIGCSSPVISFAAPGTPPQAGDSGAPFYERIGPFDLSGKVIINGHIIARCSCGTGYAVPWSVVQQKTGFTILTS
jgi:hypothetical protein